MSAHTHTHSLELQIKFRKYEKPTVHTAIYCHVFDVAIDEKSELEMFIEKAKKSEIANYFVISFLTRFSFCFMHFH